MLSDTIKQIADRANEVKKPMAIMYGEVTSVSPLSILIDSRLLIPSEAIKLPRDITLQQGDKVILLRNVGGQEYVVMGVEA